MGPRGDKNPSWRPVENRFWEKVEKTDGCWLWIAHTKYDGYGMFRFVSTNGIYRDHLAHRVSWELAFGPIPTGLRVLHHCDNPRCVRPAHLFLGTDQDNTNDKIAKGRARHKGEQNSRAKLSARQVLEARGRHAAGERSKDLAAAFGVAHTTMRNAISGKTWQVAETQAFAPAAAPPETSA